jgi:hypothetical protein
LALGILGEITHGAAPPCAGPFSVEHYAEILELCQILAQGYGRLGQEGEMARILESFSALTPPPQAAPGTATGRYRVEELLAALRTKRGDLPGAEAALRRAVALSGEDPDHVSAGSRIDRILLSHLRLADNLLAQERPPIEAELELMAGLAEAQPLGRKGEFERRPMAALAYLRLGQLLKTMSRSRDSRHYLDLASKALAAGAKAHPDSGRWYEGVQKLAAQIDSASSRQVTRVDLAALYRASLPADRLALTPASPEVMRLELTGLKVLGRIRDFRPMIETAMAWAAEADGSASPAYRRYQSLLLKFFEESGDISSLIAALDDLAANPGLPQGRESLAIKTSALRYKARVLMDHGYVTEAVEALGDARSLLVNEPEFANRLKEIEIDLQRLGASPGGAPPAHQPSPPPEEPSPGQTAPASAPGGAPAPSGAPGPGGTPAPGGAPDPPASPEGASSSPLATFFS